MLKTISKKAVIASVFLSIFLFQTIGLAAVDENFKINGLRPFREITILANGVTVELAGVEDSEPNRTIQGWWRADGSLGQGIPIESIRSRIPSPGPNEIGRMLIFRIECNDANDIACRLKIEGVRQLTYPVSIRSTQRKFGFVATFVTSKDTNTIDVKLGIAVGTRDCVMGFKGEAGNKESVYEKNGKSYVKLSCLNRDNHYDWDVIAIDKAGKLLNADSHWESSADKKGNETWSFALPLKEIERFELQRRPYEWVEFMNVQMRPLQATDANAPRNDKVFYRARKIQSAFALCYGGQELWNPDKSGWAFTKYSLRYPNSFFLFPLKPNCL